MIMEFNDYVSTDVLARNVRHIEKGEYDFYVIKMPMNSTIGTLDVSNASFTLSPQYVKKEIVETVERSYERYTVKLLKDHNYKFTKNKLKPGVEFKLEDGKCLNKPSDFNTHIIYLNAEQILEALKNSRLAYEEYKKTRDTEMQAEA